MTTITKPANDQKVTAATDWKYAFIGLDKYRHQGQLINYTVKEEAVKGYTNEQIGNSFINTIEQEFITISGNKIGKAPDGMEPPDVTVELYQNDYLYDTVTVSGDTNWETTFTDLPKYDANQQPFIYTVDEAAVSGYSKEISGNVEESFIIINTLQLGEPGKIVVTKEATGDKKPEAGVKYKFELQMQVVRTEGSNVLFSAAAYSEVTDLGDAASALNDAIDAVEASVIMTTSALQYQYFLTEQENEFATERKTLMAVEYNHTSPSAIEFVNDDGPVVKPGNLNEEEAGYQSGLTDTVVSELLKLSQWMNWLNCWSTELAKAVPLTKEDGYALTPSALQVFMNGKAMNVGSDEETGYYSVDFWLVSGQSATFDIQATTGSMIYYKIVETLDS